MTTKRMLIDASHPEETRVAIVSGQHLEDFDVEVESRRQLRGNIYLAKVTRVEPSLQAAFVDYGGNRHGFLAFSEIHPDYYQIPVADREALVAEQQEAETEAGVEAEAKAEAEAKKDGTDADSDSVQGSGVEVLGGDEADDVQAERPVAPRRRYKIQEVVKRRQILLVQVVKEERGTKGAALTTYLSLAGRYCVLMPNTARGGGISRKISNTADRKRLKKILSDLKIPGVMAVIVRTAGQKRSKAEIKRDYEYLMRLWESVREVTLESMAPCLVHEEGNLIKRSIRDLYDKDIGEIIIDGDNGYRTAKDFMKLLIPSHTKRVQPFKEADKQLFQHFQVENQLDAMHTPDAQLKSGGYIVINPTEALVAIDVNSGRSTRERNIEETALKTNLEAASEVARQLRLRDLAGLIVIDFIDMEVRRNQAQVERRLKDDMRTDRARIQLGRISPFGLLELSRQRLRPSLFETNFDPCPNCAGTGIRRSTESTALHILRAIEEEGTHQRSAEIVVDVPVMVALYILNQKRAALNEIETRYGFSVMLTGDDTLIPPEFRLERTKTKTAPPDFKPLVVEEPESEDADEDTATTPATSGATAEDDGKRRRRRRSRRRKRGEEDRETTPDAAESEAAPAEDAAEPGPEPEKEANRDEAEDDDAEENRAKRRRRGKRGGRRRPRKTADPQADAADATPAEAAEPDSVAAAGEPAAEEPEPAAPEVVAETPAVTDEVAEETAPETAAPEEKKPAARKTTRRRTPAKTSTTTRTRTRKPKAAEPAEVKEEAAETPPAATDEEKPAPKPRRQRKAPTARAAKTKAEPAAAPVEKPVEATPTSAPAPAPAPGPTNGTTVIDVGGGDQEEAKPKGRRGWWQRLTS